MVITATSRAVVCWPSAGRPVQLTKCVSVRPQFAGALVHALDKDALRAVERLGDGHGGVVGAADDGALEQHGKGLYLAHVQEHLRAAHARRLRRDDEFVLQRHAALGERLQRQQDGHHLGDGGHGAGRVGVLLKEHLPAFGLDEYGRGAGKLDGRRVQERRGAQLRRRGGRLRGRGGRQIQFRQRRARQEQRQREREAEHLAQLHKHPSRERAAPLCAPARQNMPSARAPPGSISCPSGQKSEGSP